ncbi:unnamed protein product [Pleuronectes platessa]|uniref:Protein THEM6 n=1 Tax=Pleuronectes platessa TaxID=8262 RepID=A0A9N7YS83_PLEPL|nr:unnamed protein product [Pleuronectes platessa]
MPTPATNENSSRHRPPGSRAPSFYRFLQVAAASHLMVAVSPGRTRDDAAGVWSPPPALLYSGSEQSIDGMVLPHDLDYMGHMNNSRYLRECDFARFHHYMRNGLFMASCRMGAKMVVGASTIRYRRSLAFREAFEIRTKVLGWDEKAFYLEQRFVSKKDGFVSAVMLCRQNVVRCSPESVIEFVCKRKIECPKFPEDLQHWISFITASSQALRAESGLEEKNK